MCYENESATNLRIVHASELKVTDQTMADKTTRK